jgi:hypothetical protein
MTKESNQRKSCEIESHEGRPGKAGSGLRDFDGTDYALKEASKSQILVARPHQEFVSISRTMLDRPAGATEGKHRNHETCLYPLAMRLAIARSSDLLMPNPADVDHFALDNAERNQKKARTSALAVWTGGSPPSARPSYASEACTNCVTR